MAYPFDARFVLALLVGEEDTIPTLKLASFHVFTLLYLGASGYV